MSCSKYTSNFVDVLIDSVGMYVSFDVDPLSVRVDRAEKYRSASCFQKSWIRSVASYYTGRNAGLSGALRVLEDSHVRPARRAANHMLMFFLISFRPGKVY